MAHIKIDFCVKVLRDKKIYLTSIEIEPNLKMILIYRGCLLKDKFLVCKNTEI